MKVFRDRVDAGQQLAMKLRQFAGRADAIVLALPRGGVPVAAEVARKLNLSLDVLVVRKLGAPDQPELAMGAIASSGALVMNPEVYGYFANQKEVVAEITARERKELERRELVYRGTRAPLELNHRCVILVDDGVATGATMRAAVESARTLGAAHVVVAAPVCSMEARALLKAAADEVICLEVPRAFYAVGEWYEVFDQTSDDEVRHLLERTGAPA